MKEIVIIDALRTPVGKYDGALAEYSAEKLGTHVVSALLSKNKNIKSDVEQVIFGNVLQAGNGQNIARQIAINSGLSTSVPASTINEVCGSGMKAVILAKQLLQLGEAEVVIAGGTESMSNAPILKNRKTEEETLSMLSDGLIDAFSGISMGIIGETIAEQFDVSRADQDLFAQNSQEKAVAASQAGIFNDEIVALGKLSVDETPRPSSSLEKLATLRTAFKENGTVTAGNSSPVNDGASALILATKEYAEKHGISYLAELVESAEVGIDPAIMGVSPIDAIQKLVQRSGVQLLEIDLFEINEAFAASSIAVNRELGLKDSQVNIYGGAIALGHAIGSSGAKILTTLGYALKREQKRYGIASLCIGGGLGLAILLKNPDF
ncbi:Acetyl-CoA acetyltransferase [Lactococcus cremoris subsp. cremoris SK11]|uniref:acetyl-CoA C-acetyltransferase n=2 Tax=Lactococcus lactis subsp. cremoris TaxID=1359 RepID=Q02Y10_LACLS|nr:thiolase family protein [Lactococcus cremoris]ABJ73162.1 Acetyl-CoA acetyltransferase [Lactococcus cremoris subsp. cremoris SK11]AEU40111.1 3-ketoacyl-CoA thiolase / Acetyl-CoA acetyltransferase [Lactococcus cremoris subsp. cremoris A76]ARE23773.1 thiolase family protein [Lactococcus cremoris]KZK45543.1 3-ketoacyl-CoA thiolase Acetyl-CoA acetyltransferase [Lactococcus cremoris]KZK52708.1 3-ketoacyl-CoA thiolase Acetyl-CoA acetyltransferase [Lactococcus cremoris]